MPSIPPQTHTQYLLFGSKHCTRKDTEMSENQVPALEEHTDKLGGQSSYVWTQWHMTSVMMGRWKEAMQNRGSLTQPGQGNTSRVREKGCGKGMVSAPGREKSMLQGPEWRSALKEVQSGALRSVVQSCPTLVTPWTVARQASLSIGFPRQG